MERLLTRYTNPSTVAHILYKKSPPSILIFLSLSPFPPELDPLFPPIVSPTSNKIWYRSLMSWWDNDPLGGWSNDPSLEFRMACPIWFGIDSRSAKWRWWRGWLSFIIFIGILFFSGRQQQQIDRQCLSQLFVVFDSVVSDTVKILFLRLKKAVVFHIVHKNSNKQRQRTTKNKNKQIKHTQKRNVIKHNQ